MSRCNRAETPVAYRTTAGSSWVVAWCARSVSAVKNDWQQSIFAGREVPAAELDSDEDVAEHVLKNAGRFCRFNRENPCA